LRICPEAMFMIVFTPCFAAVFFVQAMGVMW